MKYSISPAALTLSGVVLLSGCGEAAFKRGSGPDTFGAARAACQEQNADSAATRTCLSEAGWNVIDLAPMSAKTVVDTAMPQVSRTVATTPARAVSTVEAQSAAAAPSGKMAIGSWWKFGAGAADLHAAADACLARLGPDDKPDPGYHSVTRALYSCLGTHGWHGIGGSAS